MLDFLSSYIIIGLLMTMISYLHCWWIDSPINKAKMDRIIPEDAGWLRNHPTLIAIHTLFWPFFFFGTLFKNN